MPTSVIFKAAYLFSYKKKRHALQYTSANAAQVFEIRP